MSGNKIAFVAATSDPASKAYKKLTKRYGHVAPEEANVIVALGGDGHMLDLLSRHGAAVLPVFIGASPLLRNALTLKATVFALPSIAGTLMTESASEHCSCRRDTNAEAMLGRRYN